MQNKVIFMSIDGMTPDGFLQCGHPHLHEMMKKSAHSLNASAMFPSVTLPCHLSMFYSVPPMRHGTLTNTYMPPVRPVPGLMEQIHNAGGTCSMFFAWNPMRNIAHPDALFQAEFLHGYAVDDMDEEMTRRALLSVEQYNPDFIFLYMGDVDGKGGHDNGWMTPAYLERVNKAIGCVQRVVEAVGDSHTVIVTSDHGGHDRHHGSDLPVDMTIPMFFMGPRFTPGRVLENISLLDLAPTMADVLGISIPSEWEGRSLTETL